MMRLLRSAGLAAMLLTAACASSLTSPPTTSEDLPRYQQSFSLEALGPNLTITPGIATAWMYDYRGAMPHSAFAIGRSQDGRVGAFLQQGRTSSSDAEADAITRCKAAAERLGQPDTECRLVASGGVVNGRRVMADSPQQVDIFRTSPLHFLRGPEQSEGVVVYGHGYGGPGADARNFRVPGWLSGFNDAGWDILRYDRHPADDELYNTLPRLIRAVPRLRALGYRRIVLAGGSRGGWQSLLAAGEASGVDTVIAIAPAAHGLSGAGHSAVLDDWQRGLSALPSKQVRVVAVLFDDDRFDPDPERRATMLMANGLQRGVPVLALRPQRPVRGHSGDASWQFTHDYTQCLVNFVMEATPPSDIRHMPCRAGSTPGAAP